MPNWNENRMTVKNARPEDVQRIIDACTRGELLSEFFPEPDWNTTPNSDGVFPGPQYSKRYYDRKLGRIVRTWVDCSRFPDGKQDGRWYNWRTSDENWGTKWEPGDIQVSVDGDTLSLTFETAWCPMVESWMAEFSRQLPGAIIRNYYCEDGCSFFGVMEARDGKVIDICGDPYPLQQAFYAGALTPEALAILDKGDEDEADSDQYWSTYENAQDLWYEVKYSLLDRHCDEQLAAA